MDTPPPIFILTDNGLRTEIQYKLPTDATLAVGVWQDLVGTSTAQVQALRKKIR